MYEEIIQELKKLGAHTIILYGSRARGDFTSSSDIDIMAFRDEVEPYKITRWDKHFQAYLDIFITKFDSFNESYLKLAGAKILLDEHYLGKKLMADVELALQSSAQLSKNELESRAIWYQKMIARAEHEDIEASYRYQWMLHTLIEDFFAFRSMHYLGPKQGFQYLEKYHPDIHQLYEKLLNTPKNTTLLRSLVDMIVI